MSRSRSKSETSVKAARAGPGPRRSHSHSKRDALRACPLRYFYEYYASSKAVPFDPERKELLRSLKEMTGCYLHAGDVLHQMIQLYFNKGRDWGQRWFVQTACQRYDKAVTYSRDPVANAGMQAEPFPPPLLLEFHYRLPDAETIAADARGRLLKALDNFFGDAAVVALTRSLLQGEIHVERKFAGMKVAGYGIEGQIDFVSVSRPSVHILDWKMGLPVGDEQSLQLFTYGWWASLNFDIKPEAVAFQRVFLGDATVEPQRTLDPAVLRRGKARLVQDIELMKELDPYGREGNERAFSPCAKEKVCRQCKYQGTCPAAPPSSDWRPTSVSLPLVQAEP